MANEAENAIYNRLSSAPTFHPAMVDLFSMDWGLEPGDVVTVKSGDDSYNVPVYSMDLQWNGGSKVEIQSTGNQKREPLPALKRKQYASGAGGYRNQKKFATKFEQNDFYFQLMATESQWDELAEKGHVTAYTEILENSRKISLMASKTGVDGLAEGETLLSKIGVVAGQITSEVSRATAAEESLSTRVTQTERNIRLKVSQGEVSTELAVELGNVSISNGNLVVSGYVTTSQLNATNAQITNLTSGITEADWLWTKRLIVTSTFRFMDNYGRWMTKTVVTPSGTETIHYFGAIE